MSRDKNYTRMLNSKQWKLLRLWKLQQNPICQVCERKGKVSAAVDVHHITPVESATTLREMEALCFSPKNLLAVCIPCHIAIHQEAMSHTKEGHKQREDERLARWVERHSRPKQ